MSSIKDRKERRSWWMQFLISVVGTAIGVGLTFAGSKMVENNKKEELQRMMAIMVIHDIDESINSLKTLKENMETIKNMEKYRGTWLQYLNKDMTYATANVTRLYIRYKDRSKARKHFEMLREIWEDRDVIVCEGEKTRMGVGNDLLDNCKSIKRIICPSENAFDKYDEIISELKKQSKDSLILIALGPTATVLAYEMSKEGYQALDLGHLDIEYEWCIRNATKREKIINKYTNEVSHGDETQDIEDKSYENQIKKVIV